MDISDNDHSDDENHKEPAGEDLGSEDDIMSGHGTPYEEDSEAEAEAALSSNGPAFYRALDNANSDTQGFYRSSDALAPENMNINLGEEEESEEELGEEEESGEDEEEEEEQQEEIQSSGSETNEITNLFGKSTISSLPKKRDRITLNPISVDSPPQEAELEESVPNQDSDVAFITKNLKVLALEYVPEERTLVDPLLYDDFRINGFPVPEEFCRILMAEREDFLAKTREVDMLLNPSRDSGESMILELSQVQRLEAAISIFEDIFIPPRVNKIDVSVVQYRELYETDMTSEWLKKHLRKIRLSLGLPVIGIIDPQKIEDAFVFRAGFAFKAIKIASWIEEEPNADPGKKRSLLKRADIIKFSLFHSMAALKSENIVTILATSPGRKINVPGMDGFWSPMDFISDKPHEVAVKLIHDYTAKNNLKKYKGSVYTERFLVENGKATNSWISLGTTREWYQKLVAQHMNFNTRLREILFSTPGTARVVFEILNEYSPCQFPEIDFDKTKIAYRNGVFDTRNIKYYDYDDPKIMDFTDKGFYHFIDKEFPSERFMTKLGKGVDPLWWTLVPTLAFDSIFESQNISRETLARIYIVFGKMCFPAGKFSLNEALDNWENILVLIGQGGAGKGTLVHTILSLYPNEEIGIFSNRMEEVFGMETLIDKGIVAGPDIGEDFNFNQKTMQSISSGDLMSVARKKKTALQGKSPKSPVILACNKFPRKWRDDSGETGRRTVPIPFKKAIKMEAKDELLTKKIMTELPLIHLKICAAYIWTVTESSETPTNLWKDVLNMDFHKWRNQVMSRVSPLQEFFTSCSHIFDFAHFDYEVQNGGPCEPPKEFLYKYYITLDKFMSLFERWLDLQRKTKQGRQPWNEEIYGGVFQRLNIKNKDQFDIPGSDVQKPCILGIRLKEDLVKDKVIVDPKEVTAVEEEDQEEEEEEHNEELSDYENNNNRRRRKTQRQKKKHPEIANRPKKASDPLAKKKDKWLQSRFSGIVDIEKKSKWGMRFDEHLKRNEPKRLKLLSAIKRRNQTSREASRIENQTRH